MNKNANRAQALRAEMQYTLRWASPSQVVPYLNGPPLATVCVPKRQCEHLLLQQTVAASIDSMVENRSSSRELRGSKALDTLLHTPGSAALGSGWAVLPSQMPALHAALALRPLCLHIPAALVLKWPPWRQFHHLSDKHDSPALRRAG